MGAMKVRFSIVLTLLLGILLASALPCYSQVQEVGTVLDEKVKAFLHNMKNGWHDWNVPEADGRILYDIIVQNQYKHALEVGTSTGHSAVWIAWALSKTGGKLITIEIDHLDGSSAHAGQSELLDWLPEVAPGRPRIVLTHGEDEARSALAAAIAQRYGIQAERPQLDDLIVLE